jgi:hypothetical protein
MKLHDLERLGETVYTDVSVPSELLGISAAEVRRRYESDQPYAHLLPPALQPYGEALFKGADFPPKAFVIFPCASLYASPEFLDSVLSTHASGHEPAIVIPVRVRDKSDWWRHAEQADGPLSFFEKCLHIISVCKECQLQPPVVLPLFIKGTAPLVQDAYLPPRFTRRWIILPTAGGVDPIISVLSRHGETWEFAERHAHSDSSPTRDTLSTATKNFLTNIHFDYRLSIYNKSNHMSMKNAKGPQIKFGDHTHVHGDMIVGNTRKEQKILQQLPWRESLIHCLDELRAGGNADEFVLRLKEMEQRKMLPGDQTALQSTVKDYVDKNKAEMNNSFIAKVKDAAAQGIGAAIPALILKYLGVN